MLSLSIVVKTHVDTGSTPCISSSCHARKCTIDQANSLARLSWHQLDSSLGVQAHKDIFGSFMGISIGFFGPYQDEFSNIFPSNGKSIGKEGATRINNQVTASEAL